MSIQDNVLRQFEKIEKTRLRLGISYPVTVLGVTKTVPAEFVKEAIKAGITDIGENKVQEADSKFLELAGYTTRKHFIGHLQENKANKAAAIFDVIQTIDSLSLAEKLNKKALELNKTIPVMIEVNTSGEISKFGVKPEATEDLAGSLLTLSNIKLTGLMTIGPLNSDDNGVRAAFRQLHQLKIKLNQCFNTSQITELSMGMSGDFEMAIEEGSTMVRIGTGLFGVRQYN